MRILLSIFFLVSVLSLGCSDSDEDYLVNICQCRYDEICVKNQCQARPAEMVDAPSEGEDKSEGGKKSIREVRRKGGN